MRTDRETDMTKLIVASRNFENAPKNGGGTNEVCNTALGTRNNGPPKAGSIPDRRRTRKLKIRQRNWLDQLKRTDTNQPQSLVLQ